MNPLIIFGIILLIITLVVRPKLIKEVPENACWKEKKLVEDNKKYVKIFLITSVTMIIVGTILIII